jgi:hypothetical protein
MTQFKKKITDFFFYFLTQVVHVKGVEETGVPGENHRPAASQ